MKPKPIHYLIYVRPPGSHTWTMEMKNNSINIPLRFDDPKKANQCAMDFVEHSNYCAVVVPVMLRDTVDTEQYALLADGDTLYKAVPKPKLPNSRTPSRGRIPWLIHRDGR